MSIHQPISVASRAERMDWSDLSNDSTHKLADVSSSWEPGLRVENGCFPQEKSGCQHQRKGSIDVQIATAMFAFGFHRADELRKICLGMCCCPLPAAGRKTLDMILFTAQARGLLSLFPCSHDTPLFPPEVGVNGLLCATINDIP